MPIVVALLTVLALACSPAEPSPLENAHPSPDALAAAALTAIATNDEEYLRDLMITREEYETRLWPALPDRNQMPFAFVWSITGPRSRMARQKIMGDYREVPLELVRVELGADVERHEEFTLYRRSRMIVRRKDTGDEGAFPLMDTLVEMKGGWKFMNFVSET